MPVIFFGVGLTMTAKGTKTVSPVKTWQVCINAPLKDSSSSSPYLSQSFHDLFLGCLDSCTPPASVANNFSHRKSASLNEGISKLVILAESTATPRLGALTFVILRRRHTPLQ